VNRLKGAEEAAFETRKITWGILLDTSEVHIDPLRLRVQLPPVKCEKAHTLVFDKMFDEGSFRFGRWQAQVLGGNMIYWAQLCLVMWALMLRLSHVIMTLPDGPVGPEAPSDEEKLAYAEIWRVVEFLRILLGTQRWWDASFSGSVASLLPLRERLKYDNTREFIWVGGDANMNGVAAGSWTDGVCTILS